MNKFNLEELKKIHGFKVASLVNVNTGIAIASASITDFNIELASSGNAQIVKTKRAVAESLNLDDDILISLGKEYHLIRLLNKNANFFIYLVLDRKEAQLGLARLDLKLFEASLDFSGL
ncbi:MAG: roadblock/LC7 domain-containing protein [Wohlfahrtiimonas sp.]